MRYKIVSCAAVDVTGRLQSVLRPQNELGHGDTQGLRSLQGIHCMSWLKLLMADCGAEAES